MPSTPRTTRASSQARVSSTPVPVSDSAPASVPISARRSGVPVVELPSSRSSTRASFNLSNGNTSTPTRRRAATRSVTSTPTIHHHHKTADELALEEANEILADEDVLHGDARSRRHQRLTRLRSVSRAPEPGIELGEEVESSTPKSDQERDTEQASIALAEEVTSVEEDRDATPTPGDVRNEDEVAPEIILEDAASTSSESDSDADSEDSSAASDSDSDSGEDSDSDSDDDDEELEKLLQAAKVSATKSVEQKDDEHVLGGDGDVVSFGLEDEQKKREAPIPDISITKLPRPLLSFSAEGVATAADAPSIIAGPSRVRSSKGEKVPELDARPFERALSKREKAAQPRKATASELWSTLPAPKADLLPQMKRDYQALSLANSLDPKRFMKGGNRSGKIPETFAIGTLVEAPRHLQDTTLTREKQYRPGQLVQSLARDDVTESYTKRKYGDLQSKRMENGRGNGWKKQKGWKP